MVEAREKILHLSSPTSGKEGHGHSGGAGPRPGESGQNNIIAQVKCCGVGGMSDRQEGCQEEGGEGIGAGRRWRRGRRAAGNDALTNLVRRHPFMRTLAC